MVKTRGRAIGRRDSSLHIRELTYSHVYRIPNCNVSQRITWVSEPSYVLVASSVRKGRWTWKCFEACEACEACEA